LHPLTKIFIVLQALLSVMVFALVIPLAVNEETWKSRYQEQVDAKQSAEAALDLKIKELNQVTADQEARRAALNAEITRLDGDLESRNTRVADLRAQLANAQQASAEVSSRIDTLAATAETQAEIIAAQSNEITSRREQSLEDARELIEYQDELRDTQRKLAVALDAQRISEEQIFQLQREIEEGPGSEEGGDDRPGPFPPPPGLNGRVLDITTGAGGQPRAEIDLGSRDGLRANQKFIIHRNGQFVANFIVTRVDINRAVGRLELVQGELGGVQVGDRVSSARR